MTKALKENRRGAAQGLAIDDQNAPDEIPLPMPTCGVRGRGGLLFPFARGTERDRPAVIMKRAGADAGPTRRRR
jgi:hypothetical protein